ncbi:MAG: glycosyl hydrolase family 18 protein [Clostridium sp.]
MLKKFIKLTLISTLAISLILPLAPKSSSANENPKPICVGYYPYYGNINSIDANSLTHLNFAFGYIYHNENLPRPMTDPSKTSDEKLIDTLYIPQEVSTALNKIPSLKKDNPDLKTILSLGGWGGRGFCHASSTPQTRAKLCNSIKETIDKYGLDGVDIDWECPGNGGWGEIAYCYEDKQHYTLLVQDLRKLLGDEKIITIAVGPGWDYRQGVNFSEISKSLDFMNIMTYGYSYGGPKYDAALYKSPNDPQGLSTDDFMRICENEGVPKNKLVMGTPFYGRIPTGGAGTPNLISSEILNKLGLNTSYDYGYAYSFIKEVKSKPGVVERWDDYSKNPYLVYVDPQTKQESFIMSFDNEKSMRIKGRYAKDKGYAGAMTWEVSQDSRGELMNALYSGIYTDFSVNKTSDLDNNGYTDLIDLSGIATQYNTNSNMDNFISVCDLNDDNSIDIYDLTLLCRNFSR